MRVYFDNAATTPIDDTVLKAMAEVMKNNFGNPSSIHQEGRQSRTIIEKARKNIAAILNVAPGEIFFTSGGTEADNMAIKCASQDLGITHFITSPIEHHAVLYAMESCGSKPGNTLMMVNVLPDGHIDLDHLEELLKSAPQGKCLVSLMHANNEIGNLLDVEKAGMLCDTYKAYFHCDMVQTIGHLPIDLKKCKVHFTAASAHKFNGPKGAGFIYISSDVKINPFIHGGSQERNMRGGTENIYGIVGLNKALEVAYSEMDSQHKQIQDIKDYMISRLLEEIPEVGFNGDYKGRNLYTVLNVAFPPSEAGDMLLFNLDIEGVAASGGSACSSGSDAGSHVIRFLPPKEGYSAIRFSFGKYNTKEEVDLVIGKLKEILKLQTA